MADPRPPMNEQDLLRRLGLAAGASEDEVESAHSNLVEFLESAPADLQDWAQSQLGDADEAYALLSDRAAAVGMRPTPPVRPARATRTVPQTPIRTPQPASATRRSRATRDAQLAAASQEGQPFLRRIGPVGRVALALVALAGILGAAYVVYASDLPTVPGLTGTPAPEGQQVTLNTARVAELMEVLQSSPNDIATLQELADLYFAARDYTTAGQWEQRILDIDPNNVTAHLALGAAQYNAGNSADAESHWRRVIEINPDDIDALVEAHYDLGFMYFSANPPDIEKTIVEWQTVIDLAPDSDIAQTVATHLETLEQWNASASPSAGAPTPATTAPTPAPTAPTPAPTARPTPTALPSATAGQ